MSRGLPRLQRLLVMWLAPIGVRDVILDDLEEEFLDFQSRDGRPAARRWLRGQLACLDWLRLRASRRAPAPASAPRDLAGAPGASGRPGPGTARRQPSALPFVDDVRDALRRIRRRPRFALGVILTVGVGILGGATALGVVDAVLLQPLPLADGHRVVTFQSANESIGIEEGPVSWVNLGEWAELREIFDGVFAVRGTTFVLTGTGSPQRLVAALVSPSSLAVLGIRPERGRGFSEEEATPGNDDVVLLSHELWRTTFGSDAAILGRRILLDDHPYQVIGVLPPSAHLPNDLRYNIDRDIWLPLAPETDEMPRRRRAVSGHARLHDGVSIAAAQAAIDTLFASQTALDPEGNAGWTLRVSSVVDTVVGPFKSLIGLMTAAAGMLLALACVNLINLMLARGLSRRGELRVRAALGAARHRLVRQLLVEGVMLGVAGGVMGVLGTVWLLAVFTRLTPGNVPRLEQAALSMPTVTLTVVVAAIVGIVFAGVPALLLTRPGRVNAVPGVSAGASTSRSERRVLGGLVTAQLALAVALLVGAGLLGRSFVKLLGVDSGFETDSVLVVQLVLVPPTYPQAADRTRFVRQALERLGAIPGVEAAGVINFLPYSGTNTVDGFEIRDREIDDSGQAGFRAIDPGYLDVMRIPVVQGRPFQPRDVREDSPGALINEAMAAKYFAGVDPIGHFIRRDETWMQIVGVVGNVRHEGPSGSVEPEWYAPFSHDPYPLKALVARTSVPPARLAAPARAALAALDPRLAPLAVQTMDDYLDEHLASPRFNSAVLGAFAIVAILIAAQGVFGVVSHSVARRSREIGIRIALGAGGRELRNRVVVEGLALAAIGITLGFLGAAALGRALAGMLLDVSPFDIPTFGVVGVLVLLVSAAACALPARRAAAVDPLSILRD